MMKKMKFNQRAFRVIDALIEHKTVNATAEILNVSPGAVYYTLRKLREDTGKPLFIRTRHGMVPDKYAMELHEKNKALMSLTGERQTFIINTYAPVEFFIGLKLAELQDNSLLLHFRRMPLTSEERTQQLNRNFVDVDIGRPLPEKQSIKRYSCISSEMCVLVSATHSTIQQQFTPEDWYTSEHLIWLRGNEGIADTVACHEQYREIFEARNVAAESANLLAMAHACSRSDYFMLIPKIFVPALKAMFPVRVFPLPWDMSVKFNCYIHVHRGNAEKPKMKELLNILNEIFGVKKTQPGELRKNSVL
ncbi:LysR family transcriptional regulator [Klebsiella aerogenes]